jgi:pilus assembly protein CpaB
MQAIEPRWRRWLRAEVILSLVAICAGLGAAVLAGNYLNTRVEAAEADVARRYEPRHVVVASADIPKGEVLGRSNLAVRQFPREFLPADALPAERAGELFGARTAVDISRGTPLVRAAISETMAVPVLSTVLASGERAVTVSVDDISSHAGALRAGDRIDLYVARRDGEDSLLLPLLQQVEILATGDSTVRDDHVNAESRLYSTVTLRVSAANAPRVLLAQQAGELSVLLRSPVDLAVGPSAVRSTRELLSRPANRTAVFGVELLTGGTGSLVPERTWLSVGSRSRRSAT